MLVFVVAVIISALAIETVAPCDPHGRSNGCSIPGDLPYLYKNTFKPDCDKHDICYGCGKYYGVTRETCDIRFGRNTRRRCDRDPSVWFDSFCRAVARDYYVAVRLGGRSHYEDPSLYWCNENWVRNCL